MDVFTEEEKADAWKNTAETVQKYSVELVEQWNKEMDGLLTFVRFSSSSILIAYSELPCAGRIVFCNPYGVQCHILSAPPTCAGGRDKYDTRADFLAVG